MTIAVDDHDVAIGRLGAAHRGLSALALPPLAALLAAAWVAHRRLLAPALVALAAFLAAALVTPRPAHLTLAALSLASALVLVAQTFRGETVAPASWRDYVTLTKPRIMTLLLLTGAAGMFVGAGGVPALSTLALGAVLYVTARRLWPSGGAAGAVSVVSGKISGVTNTLPLHVEILYNEYNFAAAFAVASVLAVLAVVTLVLKTLAERQVTRRLAASQD